MGFWRVICDYCHEISGILWARGRRPLPTQRDRLRWCDTTEDVSIMEDVDGYIWIYDIHIHVLSGCDMIWYDIMIWCDMIWCDIMYDMIHGMICYDLIWYESKHITHYNSDMLDNFETAGTVCHLTSTLCTASFSAQSSSGRLPWLTRLEPERNVEHWPVLNSDNQMCQGKSPINMGGFKGNILCKW